MTTEQLIKNFTDACKEKGYILGYDNEYGVDEDIFDCIPDIEVSDKHQILPHEYFKQVDTENSTTENEMLKTAVKLDLSQAIIMFTKIIKDCDFDKFDKNKNNKIIFVNETRNGVPLKLVCRRYSDGKLYLSVSEVHPDDEWNDAGDAWFSSNENSDTEIKTLEALDTLKLEQAIKICKLTKSLDQNLNDNEELRELITNLIK